MSVNLTVELDDEAYRTLEEIAAGAGRTPAAWLAENVNRLLSESGPHVAREALHPDLLALLEHRAVQEGIPVEEAVRQWKLQRGVTP